MNNIDIYKDDGELFQIFWDKEVIAFHHRHDIDRTDGGPTFDIIEISRDIIDIEKLIKVLQQIQADHESS